MSKRWSRDRNRADEKDGTNITCYCRRHDIVHLIIRVNEWDVWLYLSTLECNTIPFGHVGSSTGEPCALAADLHESPGSVVF